MKNLRNAFTMIEVVFVIVIIGILAAIAVPKFATTRNDAIIARGKADISTIRSAIVSERQSQLIKGNSSWIPKLSDNNTTLFSGDGNRTLLMYGLSSDQWAHTGTTATTDTYTFTANGTVTTFTYNNTNGKFTCAGGDCSKLTK